MNKKGFTLVELLAVIVILAVIALITSAMIINIIDQARKSALEDSAYGIIEAGNLYYMNNLSTSEEKEDRYDFEIVNNKFVNKLDSTKILNFKGEMPKTGMLQINSDGKTAIAICNNDYCACKSIDELKVTIKNTNCTINSETGDIGELVDATPAGTVISYMGNNAPDGYLVCDGTVYNISDYKNLAEQIKTEFGSYNYFGGDGTTTFAVPDLRGEFLRGTGTNGHANQGNGANVGEHQDSTTVPAYYQRSTTNRISFRYDTGSLNSNSDYGITNFDSLVSASGTVYSVGVTGTAAVSSMAGASYNIRPTSTSVLYCIKY